MLYLTSIVVLFLASGLGFNIRGGSDANYLRGHPGIFVTSIKPGGSADRDSRLKIGDRLLEVHLNDFLTIFPSNKKFIGYPALNKSVNYRAAFFRAKEQKWQFTRNSSVYLTCFI